MRDAEITRLTHRFLAREGVHARMWFHAERGTGYSPVHAPLTPELLAAHLDGRVTLGIYLVRADDTVRQLVFDLDLTKAAIQGAEGDRARSAALKAEVAAEGLRLRDMLRSAGLDPVLIDSGYKGRHLWCFLPEPVPAAVARSAMVALARACRVESPNLHLELFPKQDKVDAKGLGNLVKLPLGVHRRTGRRCVVLDEDGRPAEDGLDRLLRARAVPLHGLVTPSSVPSAAAAAIDEGPPAPSVPLRPWSETDFESSHDVGAVLRGCPVLRRVVDRALAERTLSRDAAVSLTHSLGHLPDGVRAVNYVLDRVPDTPPEMRMGAPLRGSPVSCGKLRKRLPDDARAVGCACSFPAVSGRYDHPLRHLELAPPPAEPAPGLEDDLEAWGRQRERVRVAQAELDRLTERVVAAIGERGGRVEHLDGEWTIAPGDPPTVQFRRLR